MCVAIYKPKSAQLDKEDLHLAYQENHDGCGFAVRKHGKVYIEKGMWSFAEFWEHYSKYQHHECLVHFRMASMGTIDATMAHPFLIHGNGALIHNGHLSRYGGQTISDTYDWVTKTLDPLLQRDSELMCEPSFQAVLQDSIGSSRMAIMLPKKPVILLNEHLGTWNHGAWYSQTHYRDTRVWTFDRTHVSHHASKENTLPSHRAASLHEDGLCELCGEDDALYTVCYDCYRAMESPQDEKDIPWNE
jgi:predicted glutamine amidotransferase